ncbi:MAG: LptA/OstA family protein [Candidatus Eremiobacteraeota bacterium]|nr:LptA/OstA family protein [Candidatus Eremiobacteraeota bacterium]
MLHKTLYLTLLFVLSLLVPVFSQEPAKPPGEIRMTAEKLTYDDKKKFVRLINNVKVTYGEAVMTSARAEFNGVTKVGHFTGGVKLWQPGNVIYGDRMDAFYNEKKVLISGHVRALMEEGTAPRKGEQAPPPAKEQKSDEGTVIMTCEEIEFFWESRDGEARRNVKVWRKEKTAYADVVHYSHSASLITMTGNVRFERGPKDWMISPEAYFDLKTETFVARGGVESNVELTSAPKKPEKKATLEEERIMSPLLSPVEEEVFIREVPQQFKSEREEHIEKLPGTPLP